MMAALTALFLAGGDAVGGQGGMAWAFLTAAGMNLLTFYASGWLVLRAYGARTVTAEEAPELHAVVDRLRRRAELPMPTLAIAPQRQPNAFATGRDAAHAVVCVTEGARISGKPLAQVNPLAALDAPVLRRFSTHPPVEERIARLAALAGQARAVTAYR